MVAEAQKARDAQKVVINREEGDIPPAQADLDSAEEDLERAKARHAAAMRRLGKAKADLKEHDMEGLPAPEPVYDPAPAPSPPAPAPAPEPAPAPKSAAAGVPSALPALGLAALSATLALLSL